MNKYTLLAPTMARYALLVLGTKLTAGGWLPEPVAREIMADPAVVELVTGLAVAAGAVVWFGFSHVKKLILSLHDY